MIYVTIFKKKKKKSKDQRNKKYASRPEERTIILQCILYYPCSTQEGQQKLIKALSVCSKIILIAGTAQHLSLYSLCGEVRAGISPCR